MGKNTVKTKTNIPAVPDSQNPESVTDSQKPEPTTDGQRLEPITDMQKPGPPKEGSFGTPYDDVFRTLLNDCSELILPVLNEIFGEHYSGTERIVFSENEHYLNRQGGKEEQRITDSAFTVFRSITSPGKKYLFECQSTADSSLLVRIFEYATQIALDDGELTGNCLKVTIPHSAVLFLRSTGNTPDEMRIELATPGGTVGFPVRVMKIRDYTLEEIFSKKLLFLIPFYIFTHEKRFKAYERDAAKLEELKREYVRIAEYLTALEEKGKISVYTKRTLTEMTGRVAESIAAKYANVREGVKSVMGGKILEYEAKTILRKGIEAGREEGRQEGRQEGRKEGREEGRKKGREEGILITLSDLVRKRMLTVSDAAKQAGLSEEAFLDQVRCYAEKRE